MDEKNFDKRIRPILSLWRKLNEVSTLSWIQNTNLILFFLFNECEFQNISLSQSNDLANVTNNTSNPWTLFIISELLLAQNLFKVIHNTLSEIHVAIKDVSSITRNTMNLIRIICENQVPFKWRQIWSGPKSTVDYIKAVASRGMEAEKRFQGLSHIDFCDEIDFTKVYNVQSFVAALKLKNAR